MASVEPTGPTLHPPPSATPAAGPADDAATRAPWPATIIEPATLERLRRARSGSDEARRLELGDLQPGGTGVVEAVVRQVQPVRPYMRRNGSSGLLGKVTLADRTGEAVLVLWDDETRALQEGLLHPGAWVRLRGPVVKASKYGGGVELGLGAAVVEPMAAQMAASLDIEGVLLSVGPTRILGDPPRQRFQADVLLQARTGRANVVAEGEIVRSLRSVLPGAPLRLQGLQAHPLLEGWYLAGPGATVVRA